jgi:PAS domain S-box-containing protein
MLQLYGITPDEFTGMYDAWANRLHPDDRPLAEAAVQQVLQGERDFNLEFRVIHPDQSIHFIKAYAIVQRDKEGKPQRLVGINYDITARKQAEIKIQRTTAQLEASNRELEAFAYSVSHDLRSPLRAIDGFSRALLEDYGEHFDEDGKDYFNRIRHNVARMGMLIDDLLRLSRVSRSAMQYSAVDLSALAQEQINDLRASEPERQVTTVVAPSVIVYADATLMRVVLSNLLQNAWKFTSHHATAQIEFGVLQHQEQTIYFVKDDGAGFDMAFAKMLFGVFQRLHNTDEFPGTGIGLATVQRAIHRHGGKVWAEGVVEQGATVYFTLPSALSSQELKS